MVLPSRAVIPNLARGTDDIRDLAPNQTYLFYLQDDGTGRMFRLLMP